MLKTLAGKKLDEIGARLETSANKLLAQLAQPTGLFASSAGNAIHLLHDHQHKTAVVCEFRNKVYEARLKFVNCYIPGV
jgi:hypothetical protein